MATTINGDTGIDKLQDGTTVSGTGGFSIPSGTNAQRQASPSTGVLRYNTDESTHETYDGSEWVKVSTGSYPYAADFLVLAGGGGSDTIIKFTASGSYTA